MACKKKNAGHWIPDTTEFQFTTRVELQSNGLIAFGSRRIYVHIFRECDFDRQSHPTARTDDRVGLSQLQLQMRRGERSQVSFGKLGKQFRNNIVGSIALLVILFEERLLDTSITRNIDVTRERHPLHEIGGLEVKYSKPLYDCGLRIGQKRISDFMAARKFLENRLAVIAHADQADILLSKPRLCSLQLDQLQLAKGSPIRRAEEQQHQPIWTLQEFKILMCAKLIDS